MMSFGIFKLKIIYRIKTIKKYQDASPAKNKFTSNKINHTFNIIFCQNLMIYSISNKLTKLSAKLKKLTNNN